MTHPLKIYFAGAEKIDWALNEDLRLLRSSMSTALEAKTIEEADLVHSVWWGGILEIPKQKLIGKKVVCQFDNPPFHWMKQSSFRDARELVGLWIVQSREAQRQAEVLKLKNVFVPYKINTEVFQPHPKTERESFRDSLKIPPTSYVIGNFHRDTDGSNLQKPKNQKGADLFAEILVSLHKRGLPVHALLAGPRRHWLRSQLSKAGVPLSFVGQVVAGDDIKINILPRSKISELYSCLDLCLVTSRWEGGPYSILEAAATETKILSTRVGIAEDILEPASLFIGLADGMEKITNDLERDSLSALKGTYAARARESFTVEANRSFVEKYFQAIKSVPPYEMATPKSIAGSMPAKETLWSRGRRALGLPQRKKIGLTVSFFREFVKPPYGGGNQFMLALKEGLEKKGVRVLVNEVHEGIDGYYFDSLWFNEKLLDKLSKIPKPLVVHRIDGPIHLYRGKDKELDDRIFEINQRFATSTVIQSDFTLEKIFETGYRPYRPIVIRNAVSQEIFQKKESGAPDIGRKIRIVASSWSDNPKKGGPIYKWLEENLDWDRYEFTFIGRCSEKLQRAKTIAPVASEKLAELLRQQDIYITASENDPCSNALIEALSCGLPSLALKSGGHPELVGFGGLCFERQEQIPTCLSTMVKNYPSYQRLIQTSTMADVAERYLNLVREP